MLLGSLYVFLFMGDQQYDVSGGEELYQQKLPVNIITPFGTETRGKYLFTLMYTIIPVTYLVWIIVTLDALFMALMSCISAHLNVLGGAFKTLHPRCVERITRCKLNSKNLEHEVDKEMIKCIQHLQTLLRVSEQLESIYNVQTFFQACVSLGEMCFSLFLLSQTIDQSIGSEITYLFGTSLELLMYCWFGNRITEASMKLSYSIYEADWLSAKLSTRKKMILTMTRMTKPIYVTIGKITPLTLNTFLTMARGAYSFFTFLKQKQL
ncbi:odorant receptor 10-like [Tenebrio molitor]|uniref:odorant receptor 10-like n=1 Tax=Tenebrio molitor TaxID=7067 RepID=UPI0036248472